MKNLFLFTYGTLKKGFCNNYLINSLEYIDDAITCEKFQMYPCSNNTFPFVIKSERNHTINGEVYKLNSKDDLILLDKLEGYPDLYIREEIKVKLLNGKFLNTIIYLKNEETYTEYIKVDEPIRKWTKKILSSEF